VDRCVSVCPIINNRDWWGLKQSNSDGVNASLGQGNDLKGHFLLIPKEGEGRGKFLRERLISPYRSFFEEKWGGEKKKKESQEES